MREPLGERQAEAVAKDLAREFLERGNFAIAGPIQLGPHTVRPAFADDSDQRLFSPEGGFAGLSVQSVAFEKGVPQPRVFVYVTKGGGRKAERKLEAHDGTVDVIVSKIGRVIVRPEAASTATHRGKIFAHGQRIACGSSCAPSGETYAGTIGALVRKPGSQDLYALSNNHVLAACNHVAVGMPILSPSPIDAAPNVRAPDEICRHAEIVELRSGVPTLVDPMESDLAIARVAAPNKVSSWQGDDSDGYDTPSAIQAPAAGLRVMKFGRTTGLTRGTVEALTVAPFAIPYKCKHFTATVWFQDMWTIRGDGGGAFALPGDSGSLVVDEAAESAIGLIFAVAGSGELAFIVPMDRVVTHFGGLVLVNGHRT